MGLDTTHDCWHGGYSSFDRWREKLASLAGINLRSMEGFGGEVKWESLKPDALHILLNHSDCDGDIEWKDCGPLADRLAELLPLLPDESAGGHIGNWREKTQQFIDGLRDAFGAKENVEFG